MRYTDNPESTKESRSAPKPSHLLLKNVSKIRLQHSCCLAYKWTDQRKT